eukprot:gene1465-32843_t
MASSTFRVKFVSGEQDFVTTGLDQTALCEDIIRQARRELYPEDPVGRAITNVVHCMISDGVAPIRTESPRRNVDEPALMEPPPPEWLDLIDPIAVLMWILGTILVILWFLFVIYPSLFDRTSFLFLSMMTVAYFIPYILSFIPVLAFLQPPPIPSIPGMDYDPAMGMSTSYMSPGTSNLNGPIPPRPAARIPPGGSAF